MGINVSETYFELEVRLLGPRIENLHQKSTDIVDTKSELTEKSKINATDQKAIRELLNDFLADEGDVAQVGDLHKSLESDAAELEGRNQENENERKETLSDADDYLAALESNLTKLQEIKTTSDLVRNDSNDVATQKRITELQSIKAMLEGEDNFGVIDNENSDILPRSSFDDKRSSFLESLKVQVEPNIKLTREEDFISRINNSNKMELTTLVKDSGLSKNADFGNLDINVARQMVQSIYKTKKEFPFLEMNFIGSSQARNKQMETSLTEIYMNAYKKSNPDWSEDDLKPYVLEAVEADMKKVAISPNTIAQSIYIDSPDNMLSKAAQSVCGITINENYGENYESFKRAKEIEVITGHKPVGCNTPKATIDHELGHQIANRLKAQQDIVIINAYNKFASLSEEEMADTLSTYAKKNINEFIAECWSEFQNNPNCRPMAKLVGNRLVTINSASEIGPKVREFKGVER